MADRLGQYLLRQGAISQAQLKEALRTQQFFGGHLGSHLIQLGYLDEDALGAALSEIHGVAYAGRDRLRRPETDALGLLPADFVKKHRAIPFAVDGSDLHLALVNPRDALAIHEAAFLTGMSVVPHVAPEFRVLQSIEKHYRLRLDRRRGIRVQGADDVAPRASAPRRVPDPPAASTPAAPESGPEVGLDGRPLDAQADPESFPGWSAMSGPAAASPAASPGALPSLASSGERPGSGADPGAGPAASADVLDEAARSIADARTRDEVGRAALDWLASRYGRAALFSVNRGTAVGWDGRGHDFETARIKRVQVDLATPSIFSSFTGGRKLYYGPVANLPVHQDLFTYLGGRLPTSVLLAPVFLKGRLVAILYADNAGDPMPAPDLVAVRRLAAKVALGLEALILRNKILTA